MESKVKTYALVMLVVFVGFGFFSFAYFCFYGCDSWVDKEGDECEEDEDGEEELRVSDESESEDVIEN